MLNGATVSWTAPAARVKVVGAVPNKAFLSMLEWWDSDEPTVSDSFSWYRCPTISLYYSNGASYDSVLDSYPELKCFRQSRVEN